jgi:hypothetical protein
VASAKTLTHAQVDARLKAAIKAAIEKGARPQDLRIQYGELEWRWSPVLRRWDLYDAEAARPALPEEE